MKLIFCPDCEDVQKLTFASRMCRCGRSWGRYYSDGKQAEIGGRAIPIGFANRSLVEALKEQPENGMGRRFDAFVIPKNCPTIKQT